jgi:hypothetical protein
MKGINHIPLQHILPESSGIYFIYITGKETNHMVKAIRME